MMKAHFDESFFFLVAKMPLHSSMIMNKRSLINLDELEENPKKRRSVSSKSMPIERDSSSIDGFFFHFLIIIESFRFSTNNQNNCRSSSCRC